MVFLIIYVILAIINHGLCFGMNHRRYPIIAFEWLWRDFIFSILLSILVPFWMIFITLTQMYAYGYHGFKFLPISEFDNDGNKL